LASKTSLLAQKIPFKSLGCQHGSTLGISDT
jgi:hypothetical protein